MTNRAREAVVSTPAPEQSAHMPGPWVRREYSEHLGYDCMTGGIRVGPVVLDGSDYGQKRCTPIEPRSLARMEADAKLIAAAPDMLAVLELILDGNHDIEGGLLEEHERLARAAITKATGGAA